MSWDIEAVRAQFPALARDGGRRVYFDAPGGTQVCRRAIERMVAHLESGTANSGGAFATSVETDALSDEAHAAVARLLGGKPSEIAFGPNMTSLTFAVSRALGRDWGEGDEIVLTRMDHDANVAPWLLLARDKGLTVRWLDFSPESFRLDMEALPSLLSERTRLVAVGHASNALGTVNDVAAIARQAHDAGALVFVDAVQSVPHLPVDVRALGCDMLVASPYKFFGPHQGVVWMREGLADMIEAYKVRPAGSDGAHRFESGTPSWEGQAGTLGAIEHIDAIGGIGAIAAYERSLSQRMLDGLRSVPGLRLYGVPTVDDRVPTFAFTLARHHPDAVAAHLAGHGIFAWSGHFYAVEVIERLGLAASGGLVRVGLCHYSTQAEIGRLIEALDAL